VASKFNFKKAMSIVEKHKSIDTFKELEKIKSSIRNVNIFYTKIRPNLSPEDGNIFLDLEKQFGEIEE